MLSRSRLLFYIPVFLASARRHGTCFPGAFLRGTTPNRQGNSVRGMHSSVLRAELPSFSGTVCSDFVGVRDLFHVRNDRNETSPVLVSAHSPDRKGKHKERTRACPDRNFAFSPDASFSAAGPSPERTDDSFETVSFRSAKASFRLSGNLRDARRSLESAKPRGSGLYYFIIFVFS